MHELIPVFKTSFISRLKARIFPTLKSTREAVESPYKQGKRPLHRKKTPLNRLFAGPPLRAVEEREYYIAFERKKANSVNSVGRIWNPLKKTKMKCWVQFLSTPTADTPGTTLLLHFDSKRYLIGNVAEGTQRAAVQRKLGLMKVGDIFLTGTVGWGNAGGILGMILTLADSVTSSREETKRTEDEARQKKGLEVGGELEKQWLNIHGGKNLTHLLATARRFVFRKGMPLHTNEFRAKQDGPKKHWGPMWEDDKIKVWAMVLESKDIRQTNRRKRSHDEFSDDVPSTSLNGKIETKEEQDDRYDQMRKSVVSSMFDSNWRLDTLIKTKLSEVRRPAAIFVRNEEGKIERYNGPTPYEDRSVSDMEVLVRNPWPGAMVQSLPPTVPSTTSVCYIIKNHPQRGKFDPKKAKELKVKPGPNFRMLTEGKSVTAEDGSTVTPEMVLGKGKEGGGFAIIELPDASYVGSLLAREEWSSKEVMNGVGAAVWILGPGVVNDARIQKFMRDHTELKHLVSSKDCCSNYLALESAASAAIRLHLLDSERFPIPKFSNEVDAPQIKTPRPYEKARIGQTLQLEPTVELQDDKIIPCLDTSLVVKEASKEVSQLAEIARKEVMSPEYQARLDENQKDIPSKDAEVTTLGTGSALPSKYRNVSATLLRVPGYGSYLIDCGENTLGQLKRVFGNELPEILRDLKAIWISHLHADHHLGTASVVKAWAEETASFDETRNNNLVVASDEGMTNWLKEYSEVEDYGYERVEPVVLGRAGTFHYRFKAEETKEFGLTSIQACSVEHCHGALAVVLNFPNGLKVAYSGDCRPSSNFAKIGKGATLLIHEATFDDELQGDAIAKKHSTTSEALDIGKQMNARRILLTHFSQRYQKIPVMDSDGGRDQVAIVAFDYMRVKIGDFAKLEAFKPALVKLFEEKEE
jgi:ribonuclease Z